MGGGLGTHAGADSSAISVSGLAEFSDGLLELMADLARNASFPEDEFERERRQKFEELRIERTTPGFLASERLRRILFGEHPYAVVAPTEEQVGAYVATQLQEFYTQILFAYGCAASSSSAISPERNARLRSKSFRQLESAAPRIAANGPRRRTTPAAMCIWFTCQAACRRKFVLGNHGDHAPRSRLVSASCSPTRFTVAHFIRAW